MAIAKATTIDIYTTEYCPYCVRAKRLLDSKGVYYREFRVDTDPSLREEMLHRSEGRRTVPQIFIEGRSIGGCDDLYRLDTTGELDHLLGREHDH